MEDGLRDFPKYLKALKGASLNPCSCGRWSQRFNTIDFCDMPAEVLILVLVEDGLRGTVQVTICF